MTDQTIQQLNSLLNTEVTPQQLRKIDPDLYFYIQPTKRAVNNRVTHGILLGYHTDLVHLAYILHQKGFDMTSLYQVDPQNTRSVKGIVRWMLEQP